MDLRRFAPALAAATLAFSLPALAAESIKVPVSPEVSLLGVFPVEKAGSAQTLGSRATVTPTATLYGGFEITQTTIVYILVRGNSLNGPPVNISNYLDLPRVRIYNSAGQDLINDGSGRPGFNGCVASNTTTDLPVINFYANRGHPPNERDGCLAGQFSPGVYTFTVTPSIPGSTTTTGTSSPGSGEVLFEITLNP